MYICLIWTSYPLPFLSPFHSSCLKLIQKPETNLNHALLPIIVVDPSAGTFASFYYKNIRDFDTPTKDHIVAFGQDERFTVGAFDVSFPSMYYLIIGIFKF